MTPHQTLGPQPSAKDLAIRLANAATLEERVTLIASLTTGRIAFSTSLGMEDQAILHAVAGSSLNVDLFTLDTGRHFQETLDTIEASELRYGVRIRVIAPPAADIETLVARDGINGFRLSIEARKACCEIRKVVPLRRALRGAAVWITGLRRGQSTSRDTVPFAVQDESLGVIKVSPIADWSLERLRDYVRDNNVPLNALHARGFPSIGCQPCTRPIRDGEDIRAGRWWWENEDGKECGLHKRPSTLVRAQ
jgi:phosphoadenosine phosphosulfate reductase